MKRTLLATLAATAAAASTCALAEDRVVVIPPSAPLHFAASDFGPEQADAWKRWADEFSRDMRASMGAMFAPRAMSSKVVKGAPYSAQLVTETVQSLADGNTITRKKTGAVYRDGEGRTRQETAGDGKDPTVYISDPVEGKTYVLNPGAKRAMVLPRIPTPPVPPVPPVPPAPGARSHTSHKQVVSVDGTEVRVENGRVFVDGKEATSGNVDIERNGKRIVVANGRVSIDGKPVGRGDGSGSHVSVHRLDLPDGTQREEVRVHVIRTEHDMPMPPTPPVPPMPGFAPHAPLAPLPPMPGVDSFRFESPERLGKGVTSALGSRDFDGVKAEGKQTTWTIPAGQIGNAKPINITSERWYSPELEITVYSRYNDPRTGETLYRLQGIRRGEPAADLFRVPEDYKSRGTGAAPKAKG